MESPFELHRRQVPNIQDELVKIVELADVGRGWTFVNSTGNVNCYYQKCDKSPFNCILGEGVVHANTDALSHFFQNGTTDIDPSLIERDEIVRLSEQSRVLRLRYKWPALLSNREFVIHSYDGVVTEDPKVVISAGISVEHEMCKEHPDYVRGVIMVSGYVCKEITQAPPRTHVSYVVQFDPKGWIPAWIVNMIATEQAYNVLRIKEYFDKIKTEQTYKFPSNDKTVETANDTDIITSEGITVDHAAIAHVEWHEENLSDAPDYDATSSFADDPETQATLLGSRTAGSSRLMQFFS